MPPRVRRLLGFAAVAILVIAGVRRLVGAGPRRESVVDRPAPPPDVKEHRVDRIGGWWTVAFLVLAVAVAPAVGSVQAYKAHRMIEVRARLLTGGDPAAGKDDIARSACGSCHTIPGVPGASGLVGPPLKGVGDRVYLAGLFQNTPSNMEAWIAHPQEMKPGDAMPDTGLTDQQARDVAAYLYTAR